MGGRPTIDINGRIPALMSVDSMLTVSFQKTGTFAIAFPVHINYVRLKADESMDVKI